MYRTSILLIASLGLGGAVYAQSSAKKLPSPATMTPGMVLPHGDIKPSAAPNDPRIYLKGDDGKVNRMRQPKEQRARMFPKADTKLKEREETQFHHGWDFPTPEPTPFKAGVYGTVVNASGGKVLVALPNGNVIHYLHASEVKAKFGDQVTPDTILGKTSDHLHVQATGQKNKVVDVDQAFLSGREKPKAFTPFKYTELDFIDIKPDYVDARKPVVVDGVLQYELSKRFYYDENALKSFGVGRFEENLGYDGHCILEIAADGKYYTGDSGQAGAQKGAKESYRIADAELRDLKRQGYSRPWKLNAQGHIVLQQFFNREDNQIAKLKGDVLSLYDEKDPTVLRRTYKRAPKK